jgi:hypothetical protein
MNLPTPLHFSDWQKFTTARMYVDQVTGEVQVRAGFKHKVTGKIRVWWRPASEEEIREWKAKDE